nr:PREDICTED: synaptic vesicle glycoprotein 2C-like [Latimeria chalumnae]|eukprot:XP_005994167.1 PREDICTED: synaptic vesicle glycoprotein 2C-like [Latimeria chalumnae]
MAPVSKQTPAEKKKKKDGIIYERSRESQLEDDLRKPYTYEEAIEAAGFGWFHALLLLACGWANASDAVEILCVSFLLPTARCDLHLSTADMGWLTSSIFLGMMIGGYVWGSLADREGRRKVLILSLTVNGIFGALASLSPYFWLFLLLRFISGIGVGGSVPVIFSYFSEFQPRSKRGAMISGLATFWMAGNILAAGLAWLIIPNTSLYFQLGKFQFQSWRLFVVLCSIPSCSSAFVFAFLLPESPRFLMEHYVNNYSQNDRMNFLVWHHDTAGQEEKAIKVFRQIFSCNNQKKKHTFAVTRLKLTTVTDGEKSSSKTRLQRFQQQVHQSWDPFVRIFTAPHTSRSILLFIIFFSISFGYYGLWMWFPELFGRIEKTKGSPCSNVSHQSNSGKLENVTCYPVNTAVYQQGFLTAAANLPGNVLTILVMDVIGGRILLSASLLLSGISVFFIWLVKNKIQSLVVTCLFSAISVTAWNALDVLGTELYPTQLRSSALGFFTGVGRVAAILGNLTFAQLVDIHCAVPILLVSVLLFTGGLAALKLPDTKNIDLE